MDKIKKKRTMPLGWAIVLIAVIALAGGLAFYLQLDRTKELVATAEMEMAEQQYQTLLTFDQIEKNLAKIREHESMIQQDFTGPDKNGNLPPEDRIQREISFIEYLLEENNNLIASLEEQLNEKDFRLSGYEKTVKDLKSRLSDYQNQLDVLVAEKEMIQRDLDQTLTEKGDLLVQVDLLGKDLESQSSIIEDQKQSLLEKDQAYHQAYYTIGTYKDLRNREVLEKEGGLLGINRVTTLVDNPDSGQFEKIDRRDVTKFPIFSKRFEIVNNRDPSSYTIEYTDDDRAEWLTVTDPERFWKKSRYLVIVVRDSNYDELAQSR